METGKAQYFIDNYSRYHQPSYQLTIYLSKTEMKYPVLCGFLQQMLQYVPNLVSSSCIYYKVDVIVTRYEKTDHFENFANIALRSPFDAKVNGEHFGT